MSFTFQVQGHAGNGMPHNDEEEGVAVKALCADILAAATNRNLNVTVASMSPGRWTPPVTDNVAEISSRSRYQSR